MESLKGFTNGGIIPALSRAAGSNFYLLER
jgi:hypothetical protein